jgi:hypothetical protein
VNRRLLIAAVLLAACGGGRSGPAAAPVSEQPLASFATMRLLFLPVQAVTAPPGFAWASAIGNEQAFRARADSALDALLRERGITSMWAMPSDMERTARRNPQYAIAPKDIRAGYAARVLSRSRDDEIPEPVASQLRTLAGFHDARHALVPVEIRAEPGSAPSTGRLTLRVAVLDLRASRLVFIGDIVGADAPTFTPDLSTALARRFVDLIAPR